MLTVTVSRVNIGHGNLKHSHGFGVDFACSAVNDKCSSMHLQLRKVQRSNSSYSQQITPQQHASVQLQLCLPNRLTIDVIFSQGTRHADESRIASVLFVSLYPFPCPPYVAIRMVYD